jgi:membrane-associated protein
VNTDIQPILISHLDGLSYALVFLVAFLAGYLVPAPEEVIFVLLGYLAVFQDINIWLVILVSILGVVLADNIVYYLGLKGSFVVEKFKKRMAPEQFSRYEKHIHRFAGQTIFTSRFIPTIRVFVPILSGTMKVRWQTFFKYNLAAAVLDVGGLILVGYIFESQISRVLSGVEMTRHVLSIFSLIIIGAIISFIARSIFFKKGK